MKNLGRDPRHYQLAVLGSLLLWGIVGLDFEVRPAVAGVILAAALSVQWLGGRLAGLARFEPRSALISTFSLILLLRTTSPAVAALAAALTIGGKFVLRVRGKHVWNPTNFGLAAAMLVTDRAWVSPGQWGSAALGGLALASLGFLVVRRAERSDVTWAFLAAYCAVVFGRALWLGDPLAIPLHQLASGAFLIFAFFMISDPKTTPDSRPGRVLYAVLVALGAGFVQFHLFRTNGLIWSLAALAPTVPWINRLLPGRAYRWPGRSRKESPMPSRRLSPAALLLVPILALLAPTAPASAFCGFYVAKADTELFNRASKVVMVREGDRTVLTMASDYRGTPDEFALVVPVPTFIERDQIHVGNRAEIEHLDAYTAPRLVEYYDDNPCRRRIYEKELAAAPRAAGAVDEARAQSLGVTVEAAYTVGEYDILILSAKQSRGLETWLTENGYRIPRGASAVLASYLKQDMHFFVAKVNLAEQKRLGYSFLRPLQIAYETPKFMLPIRLGTVNAAGPQELFVFALTHSGRVETTNYRTVKLPSGVEVPLFVKNELGDVYRALFDHQVREQGMRAVFLEYAWDMGWCDPCAAQPLSRSELRDLGVFWLDGDGGGPVPDGKGLAVRPRSGPTSRPIPSPAPRDVFVTRLHVRYDRAHFPEDLIFQETGDRTNFQGRYVLRHDWTGSDECAEATRYRQELPARREARARALADLTGWDLATIRGKMGLAGPAPEREPWWKRIWPGG
jgi:hypothetical protein